MPQVRRRNLRSSIPVVIGMRELFRLLSLVWLLSALILACSALPGSAPTIPPSSTSGPSASGAPGSNPELNATATISVSPTPTGGTRTPVPVTQVTSPAQAAAVVFASDPKFSSVTQAKPGAIGQAVSYQASQGGDGFTVSITMGSGDCLAGCINQHTWNYSVSGAGAVTLVSEQGDPVEAAIDHGSGDPATVAIRLVAGPVCPVERNPPDPSCAPRPVPNADVIVRDPSGQEVAQGMSDAQGSMTLSLPGGAYYVEASAAQGLMRVPEPQAFSVPGGRTASIVMEYDTGIR